jgi:hypothetical protein
MCPRNLGRSSMTQASDFAKTGFALFQVFKSVEYILKRLDVD